MHTHRTSGQDQYADWLSKDKYLGTRQDMGMGLSMEDTGPEKMEKKKKKSIWPLRINDPLKTKYQAVQIGS